MKLASGHFVAGLSDKPAWFTEIYQAAIGADKSSNGKVPVIKDSDGTILTVRLAL